MLPTLLLLINIFHFHFGECNQSRELELSKIKTYELIYFPNVESFKTTNTIQFDVFNQHYNVELDQIKHMIPSNIRHINIKSTDPYYTSLKQSCHYYGKVLNTKEPSSVILSLCHKNGIRGHITAFNKTIHIKPSAYYLDIHKDKYGFHELSDQHLVYKSSDYDMNTAESLNDITQTHLSHRRLADNDDNVVETLILNGPLRTKWYLDNYSQNKWYEQMITDYQDIFAQINEAYSVTEWKPGPISIRFSQIEVLFNFDGDYTSLAPPFLTTNCAVNNDDMKAECCNKYNGVCAVDEDLWVEYLTDWLLKYKDLPWTFDAAQLVSNQPFRIWSETSAEIGKAWYRGICNEKATSVVLDVHRIWGWKGDKYPAHTMAHEIGHNFDMKHDGSNGCAMGAGVMDGGSLSGGFSKCSVKETEAYFEKNDLGCLSTQKYNEWSDYKDLPSNVAVEGPTITTTTTTTTTTTSTPDTPTTTTTTENPGDSNPDLLFYDSMDNWKEYWEVASDSSNPEWIEQVNDKEFCTSSSCVRMGGGYNYITRKVNLDKNYRRFKFVFDLIMDNMETDDECKTYYKLSTDLEWVKLKEYEGDDDNEHQEHLNQEFTFSITKSVEWVTVTLDIDASSNKNNDICYWDNVYLYGIETDEPIDHTTTANPMDDTCHGYSCVRIKGLKLDGTGYDFNGDWKPRGCLDNYLYYTLDTTDTPYYYYYYNYFMGNDRYLCYNVGQSRWIISHEVNQCLYKSKWAKCKNDGDDIVAVCQDSWAVLLGYDDDGSNVYGGDKSVVVSSCGGGSALTVEDEEKCTENARDLEERICIYANNTQWNGTREFVVYDGLCNNNYPLYHYTIYNNTNGSVISTYYLHYASVPKSTDTDEMMGRWVISKDRIRTFGDAQCDEEDLMQCIVGKWMVKMSIANDGLQLVVDESMGVNNDKCGYDVGIDDASTSNGKKTFAMEIVIVLIVLIILMIGCCLIRNNRKQIRKKTRLDDYSDDDGSMNRKETRLDDDYDDGIIVNAEITVHSTNN